MVPLIFCHGGPVVFRPRQHINSQDTELIHDL